MKYFSGISMHSSNAETSLQYTNLFLGCISIEATIILLDGNISTETYTEVFLKTAKQDCFNLELQRSLEPFT